MCQLWRHIVPKLRHTFLIRHLGFHSLIPQGAFPNTEPNTAPNTYDYVKIAFNMQDGGSPSDSRSKSTRVFTRASPSWNCFKQRRLSVFMSKPPSAQVLFPPFLHFGKSALGTRLWISRFFKISENTKIGLNNNYLEGTIHLNRKLS